MLRITSPREGEDGKGEVKCLYMVADERDHLLFLSEKEVLPSSSIVDSEYKEPAKYVDNRQVCGWNFSFCPKTAPKILNDSDTKNQRIQLFWSQSVYT